MVMNGSEYKYIGFIGCYTKPGQADPFEGSHGGIPHDRSKIGRGVLAIGIDKNGRLSYLNNGAPVIKAEDLPNPSYLSFNGHGRDQARLCVVSELEEGKWRPFRLELDRNNHVKLQAAGEFFDTGGSYPCHVTNALGPDGADFTFICNYGEEKGVFSIIYNYNTLGQKSVSFGAGSQANLTRQQNSHAHSSCVAPLTTHASSVNVCAVDLGSDSIIQFTLTPKTDDIECIETGRLAAPAGSGPRSCKYYTFSNLYLC